jgi:hypothetical protein
MTGLRCSPLPLPPYALEYNMQNKQTKDDTVCHASGRAALRGSNASVHARSSTCAGSSCQRVHTAHASAIDPLQRMWL